MWEEQLSLGDPGLPLVEKGVTGAIVIVVPDEDELCAVRCNLFFYARIKKVLSMSSRLKRGYLLCVVRGQVRVEVVKERRCSQDCCLGLLSWTVKLEKEDSQAGRDCVLAIA